LPCMRPATPNCGVFGSLGVILRVSCSFERSRVDFESFYRSVSCLSILYIVVCRP
jgi:hypothetical protein